MPFLRNPYVCWSDSLQIAGVYAQDGLNIAKARDSFVRAGDWYKQEDANALVSTPVHAVVEDAS